MIIIGVVPKKEKNHFVHDQFQDEDGETPIHENLVGYIISKGR